MERRDIVVIGASTGGVRAIRTILSLLPAHFPAAIFVVVHVSPDSPGVLPVLLNQAGPLPAVAARHGAPIEPGRIYVAPPDQHLGLERGTVRLSHGPRENRHRPSIDVLFRSAAVACGARVVGVVLSGMLDDGAAGLWAIKRRGGMAVVQDPADAESPDMPRNAIRTARVDAVLPVREIAPQLMQWIGQPTDAVHEAAPAAMVSEVRMAVEDASMEQLDALGRRVPLTCPECGGALWEIDDTNTPRFRCHVGHAYSMQTLATDQSSRVEAAIWAALRALEEDVRISEHMARAASDRSDWRRAEFHEDRSLANRRHAQALRDMLREATTATEAELPDASPTG